MPIVRPTLSEIRTRVRADISSQLLNGVPILSKAFLYILANSIAMVAHLIYGMLVSIAKMTLIKTADYDTLKARAAEEGMNIAPETYASGTILCTGFNGTVIPLGTIFEASTDVEYETTAEEEIAAGEATVPVRARSPGTDGNLSAGTTLTLQLTLNGIDSEANVISISGGAETLDEEELRADLLEWVKNPPMGGSDFDYIRWAKSRDGVRKAWSRGSYFGGGTVLVLLAGQSLEEPEVNTTIEDDVSDYIETVRPTTANVTVSSVTKVEFSIEISIQPYLPELSAKIEENLLDLFQNECEPGGTIYLSRLRHAISLSGVQDYSIDVIEKNAAPIAIANHTLGDFEYPVLVEVIAGVL
jgi:uncharacterized phage protein gp47/JayE